MKVMVGIRIEKRGMNLLATIGTALILGATFFTESILSYFIGGVCFGLIFNQMFKDYLNKR
jgi:hypothetical protein